MAKNAGSGGFDIAVVGPIPRDHIASPERKYVRYGCVLHPTAALSRLIGNLGRVVPVSHVRQKDLGPIRTILKEMEGVEVSHVTAEADRGDVIHLDFQDEGDDRCVERQTGLMDPIGEDDIADLCDVDAFVFVPVTSFEVPLEVLRCIRERSDALIVFDAHGPTMTCTRDLKRERTFWVDHERWLPFIDVLKMNEVEAGCLWCEEECDLESYDPDRRLSEAERRQVAERCLGNECLLAVCITLAGSGCEIYFRDGETARVEQQRVEAVPVEGTYSVGCGDSFAAGFTYGFLRTDDFVAACRFGNAVGAQRCVNDAVNPFQSLAATIAQIRESYGDDVKV